MKKYLTMTVCLFAIMLLMAACAKKRPVLYPNSTYKAAGASVAKADIDGALVGGASLDPDTFASVIRYWV